ncbi:MAG: 3-dehydroquinate synthase [Holophagales bacterium]|nr:3-dehydroquinate synthase [Holophagales bacterium]
MDVPIRFPTQVALLEAPSAEYLPKPPWTLLGDANVRPIWQSFGMPEPPSAIWAEAGESTKRMEFLASMLEHWASRDVDKDCTLVVLGGGTLSDVGGLAAKLYMRGIKWHAWPTTLLAQIDAAIGGKTAINLDSGKNLAGAFHSPEKFVAATKFLDYLPARHQKSGKWEMIKMALVAGDAAWAESLLECQIPSTADMERALNLKIAIVHSDFKDNGARRTLNLGHTLGHAYESASNYQLLHGEAIGLGSLAACLLSESLAATPFPARLIDKMAAHLSPLARLLPPWEECLPYLRRDKKSANGKISYIVPVMGSAPAQKEIQPEALGPVHAKLLLKIANSEVTQ